MTCHKIQNASLISLPGVFANKNRISHARIVGMAFPCDSAVLNLPCRANQSLYFVHHSTPVKAWLAERTDKIEVFYLPSYSPELNPEERLNADLKQAIGKRVPVRTKAKLRAAANQHMDMLGSNPERVRSFFQGKRVKYAV